MTDWLVDNSTLQAYLPFVQAGDRLLLAPGVYSGQTFNNLFFGQDVTITSADPSNKAVLTEFSVTNSTGLTFSNVELFATAATQVNKFAFNIQNSNDIHFDHVQVHGSMDGDPSDDPNGLSFIGSSNISVTNSEFVQLGRGMGVGAGSNVVVTGNVVHEIRTDGFDFAQVDHVTITGNDISNFHPATGDHPDAIQFWTSGTTVASHDITVSGNLIQLGSGQGMQGIFFRDQVGTLPYNNLTIDNNFINTGFNAIRISGANNIELSGNELVSYPGKDSISWILVQQADHVTATNNDATSIGWDHVTNLVETHDTINTAVADGGAAALQVFATLHPEEAALLSPYLTVATAAAATLPTTTLPAAIIPSVTIPEVTLPMASMPDASHFVMPTASMFSNFNFIL